MTLTFVYTYEHLIQEILQLEQGYITLWKLHIFIIFRKLTEQYTIQKDYFYERNPYM